MSSVYKETNTVIVLDDCAASQDMKSRVSELVRLTFSARHFNLSTIVITQQLTSSAKPYRENISKLVTLCNPNRNDMKAVLDDYLYVITKDEIEDIVDKLYLSGVPGKDDTGGRVFVYALLDNFPSSL